MIGSETVLAVIPARGGSKRFPRKNLAELNGRSLIEWACDGICESAYIDEVFVSTDSLEIANHANQCGLISIMRPKEIAGDESKSEDALRHAVSICPECDWLVLLQPTSPLRSGYDIDRSLERARICGGCISYRERNGTRNGAVYVIRRDLLMTGRNFDVAFPAFYLMPDSRSLDIDYPEEITHLDLIQSHCAS